MDQEAHKFGLETIKIQTTADQGPTSDHVQVAENQMELGHGFSYLGSHIEADGGSGPQIQRCRHWLRMQA